MSTSEYLMGIYEYLMSIREYLKSINKVLNIYVDSCILMNGDVNLNPLMLVSFQFTRFVQ